MTLNSIDYQNVKLKTMERLWDGGGGGGGGEEQERKNGLILTLKLGTEDTFSY